MTRKPNEGRSYLHSESGAAPAPSKRKRTVARAKVATASQTAVELSDELAAPDVVSERFSVVLDPAAEREEIARLAYLLWESRGGQGGSPEEDWFRAEQEYRRNRVTAGR